MKNPVLIRGSKLLLSTLLVGLLALPALAAPKRLLSVSITKGFRHDVIPAADEMLGRLAEKSGKFELDYVRTDEDMAKKMTLDALIQYDGVIFNNTTGDLPLPDREGFLTWIKSGKAFVGLHAATDTYPGFPAYDAMIGAHFLTHGAQVEVEVLIEDPQHPACRHFSGPFKVFDEIYQVKNFQRSQVRGLLTLDKHPNTGAPGDYPISWCKSYGQGQVFYTSLGHRVDVIQRADIQQHILGGILWALGLEPGRGTPQSKAYSVSPTEAQEGFKPLFNGVDLAGWKLRRPDGRPSWSAQNGMLVNTITGEDHGTDLVTEQKFRDFMVRYEYMVPKGANSGFYLRGRYEIQVLDDGGSTTPSSTGDGSFYNFAAPAQYASLPVGQWNKVEATLVDNRATVILNGKKIHDNLLIEKPTGGELDNQINEPGPIFLQGDHGAVAFRNLRIKVLK